MTIDLFIKEKKNFNAIKKAISLALKVNKNSIFITSDLMKLPKKNAPVFCIVNEWKGDFSQGLSIYAKKEIDIHEERDIILNINKILKTWILFSDDCSDNPFSMLVANEENIISKVFLDPNSLDDDKLCIQTLDL